MLREQRLAYCKQCLKRSFRTDKGIVCSLTGEHATFDVSCADYEEDSDLVAKNKERNRILEEKELNSETWGLSSIGIKNLVVVGVIFLVLSIVAQAVLFFSFGLISLYPIIVFALAIATIVKGVSRNKEKKKKKQGDILDDQLLN